MQVSGRFLLLQTLMQIQRDGECPVKFTEFLRREPPHVSGQGRLRNANKLITMDAAVVFEAFVNTDRDLGRKPMVS